ncbi:MAG: YicC family protein [Prevotella sp.]|nr:YicC family protein [Prevotella sp.]
MIHSMTGYGQTVVTHNNKKIHIEIKSLNSKNLDVTTRIATIYREHEMEIRQNIATQLLRGKIDLAIWIEHNTEHATLPIDPQTIKTYYTQLKDIITQANMPEPQDWLQTILRMPDAILHNQVETLEEEEWAAVHNAINQAITQLIDFRKQEGNALYTMFQEKISNIETLMQQIDKYETQRVDKIKSRIIDNLQQLHEVEYDRNRLEQELIYYIEKLDISEEKQRLANHLTYFTQTMNDQPGQGKKLGFIAQEMGREINTTGSKSNNAEMQNIVVKMKDELEQIKEQVLNVL